MDGSRGLRRWLPRQLWSISATVATILASTAGLSGMARAQSEPNLTARFDEVAVCGPDYTTSGDCGYSQGTSHEGLTYCDLTGVSGKVLEFEVTALNQGNADWHLTNRPLPGAPGITNDPYWLWARYLASAPYDYFQRDFGAFYLIDRTTQKLVGTNQKLHFAFFEQGLGAGWDDGYGMGNGCQFVALDGVPDGTYDLVWAINMRETAIGSASEATERPFDNAASVTVQLSGLTSGPSQATIVPPSWLPAPPTSIASGLGLTTAPAVVSREIGTYDAFYIGADGKLYTKSQGHDGTGWQPTSASGALVAPAAEEALVGPPAATALTTTDVRVFARGASGTLYDFHSTADGWTAVHVAASAVASPPAATARTRENGTVGWIGTDGKFRSRTFSPAGWGVTVALDATVPTNQTPALVASGSTMLHVFLRSATGSVLHNCYSTSAGWSGWDDLGGSVVGSLSAASPVVNRVDVVARTATNQIVRNTWNGTGFSGWVEDEAITDAVSDPTIISAGPNTLDVLYIRNALGYRYRRRHLADVTTSAWTFESTFLAGLTPSIPVVATSWASSTLDLFLGQSGAIVQRSLR